MKLYHSDIFVPSSLELPEARFQLLLSYSNHALQSARERGIRNLPSTLRPADAKLIEVEANGTQVEKILYRVPNQGNQDLLLAIKPTGFGRWLVKTVWQNRNTDNHKTLDTSRYEKE